MDDDAVFGAAGLSSTPNRGEQARAAVKAKKVPRKVIKLSPWWKGPEWESQLGQGTEGLEPYRLQLLNGKAPRCPNPAQTDTDVQMPLSRLTPLHTPAPTPPRHSRRPSQP